LRNHHDIKKITCIQLSGEFPDFCYRLVMPGYGMPFIGTVLAEDGYDVKVYMEHVKAPEGSRIAESDLVKMSEFIARLSKTMNVSRNGVARSTAHPLENRRMTLVNVTYRAP